MADKRRRLLIGRVRRKAKKSGWTPALLRLDALLWSKLSTQVIERAMGI